MLKAEKDFEEFIKLLNKYNHYCPVISQINSIG